MTIKAIGKFTEKPVSINMELKEEGGWKLIREIVTQRGKIVQARISREHWVVKKTPKHFQKV